MATATNLSINCIFTFRDTEETEESIILKSGSLSFFIFIFIFIFFYIFVRFTIQFLIFRSYLSSIFYSYEID